jgi:hypothetical protein
MPIGPHFFVRLTLLSISRAAHTLSPSDPGMKYPQRIGPSMLKAREASHGKPLMQGSVILCS